jgi:phospholipid/cholesterol/gamma-HCH transport system permease protein
MMETATASRHTASVHAAVSPESATVTLALSGRLDMNTTGALWQEIFHALKQAQLKHVIIDASDVTYCNGAGAALIAKLRQYQKVTKGDLAIHGLQQEFRRLLDLYGEAVVTPAARTPEHLSAVEHLGRAGLDMWRDMKRLLEFIGELAATMFYAARHPRLVRWRDAWLVAEQAGVNALPVIALIGLLLGLILAFESAMSLRRFGADIFVANLIGLAMLREMGPLMTAIILTGRSGSAFAAEIGTMKVREEIDALTTMGLEPVRFLVLPRVLAAVVVTPVLTVFAIGFGLFGGGVVMRSLGYPFVAYVNQMLTAVTVADLRNGLIKSLAYGIVVAAIGCLRGLQTTTGASAVGQSTTNAVVSGIVLIAIVDGIFALVYYALDW